MQMNMPKLSLTMTEGTIVQWLKPEGQRVQRGEPLVEILTDKITVVEEAPADGIISVLAPPEAVVEVGKPIAVILEPGEKLEDAPKSAPDAASTSDSLPRRVETVPAEAGLAAEGRPPHSLTPAALRVAREKGLDVRELEVQFRGREKPLNSRELEEWLFARPRLTPLAAKTAQERGLGPDALQTPPAGGRLRLADLEATVSSGRPGGKTVATRRKLSGMRKLIAERMVASKHAAPHVTLNREVDVGELESLRHQLNEAWGQEGIKVTVTDFCVLASARALERFPQGNVSLKDGEVLGWAEINVGVAVAAQHGLTVPVIRGANRLSLREAARIVRELTRRTREGKVSPEELDGGTFTVSNLGMFGVDTFTPVINQPESAILGVGRVLEKPAVWQGGLVARKRLNLSLSFDHRVMDGAEAAGLLAHIAQSLEQPLGLLLS